MVKYIAAFFFFLLSFYSIAIACNQADITDSLTFCSTFEESAVCHCVAHNIPKVLCTVDFIYNSMTKIYRTVEGACSNQSDTDKQTCIDDWQCYLTGGIDSRGHLCNGTGEACPKT